MFALTFKLFNKKKKNYLTTKRVCIWREKERRGRNGRREETERGTEK